MSNSKSKRGLPEGFRVHITPETLSSAPVNPPDYLDAVTTVGQQSRAPRGEAGEPERPKKADKPRKPSQKDMEEALQPRPSSPSRTVRRKKQINLTAQTEDHLDALVDLSSQYSEERNVKASDVAEAIFNAAYAARSEIDFSRVRSRGRWGTATATAFRDALRAAFEQAIARRYLKQRGVDLDMIRTESAGDRSI